MSVEQAEAHEPSMEEILSSIRKIISSEEQEESDVTDSKPDDATPMEQPQEAGEQQQDTISTDATEPTDATDVLDFLADDDTPEKPEVDSMEQFETEAKEDQESSDTGNEESAIAFVDKEDEGTQEPVAEDEEPAQMAADEEKAEDDGTEEQSLLSKNLLSQEAAESAAQQFARLASTRIRDYPGCGNTLQDLVSDLLRPMLKEWLDHNLPEIVQEAVDKEVRRIAGQDQLD